VKGEIQWVESIFHWCLEQRKNDRSGCPADFVVALPRLEVGVGAKSRSICAVFAYSCFSHKSRSFPVPGWYEPRAPGDGGALLPPL
jgi:hypothetical protein